MTSAVGDVVEVLVLDQAFVVVVAVIDVVLTRADLLRSRHCCVSGC